MRKIKFLVLLFIVYSCNKEKFFDGPDFYTDDFESYSSFDELFLGDDVNWSFKQFTREENTYSIDTNITHSGNQSIKCFALKSTDEKVSKCSFAKQNMAFWEGETMRTTAWYYIDGNNTLKWLFIMVFEEQTAIGAGPGMRLALVDNKLRVEYKFYEKDIVQEVGKEIDFPRNQWVEVKWEVKLSKKNKGAVRLWQDGQLIIDTKNNRTLPKDILYSLQGTKGMYSSVEVGITANSRDNDLILYVDDVKMEKVE